MSQSNCERVDATILFDLDGTLTDSGEGITRAVEYALDRCGITVEDRGTLGTFVGPPLLGSFRTYEGLDPKLAEQAVAWYREYYATTGIYEQSVYPGISDMLAHLSHHGARLLLATSKPTPYATDILAHLGLAAYFEHVVGSNFDLTRTDKAEVIAAALAAAQVHDKSRAVMVGDRMHDIIGARSNGIAAVGVTYGYGSLDELRAAEPTYLAQTVAELRDLLTRERARQGQGGPVSSPA